MKKSIYRFAAVGVLLTTSAWSFNALADDDIQEMQAISKEFGFITLDEAKAKSLAAKSGVVTDADLERRKFGDGWDYEFEIVDADGKEWEVNIDAKTGAVNGVHRDWF